MRGSTRTSKHSLRITIDFTPATVAEAEYAARRVRRWRNADPYYGDYFNPFACPGSDIGMSCFDYGIMPWGNS